MKNLILLLLFITSFSSYSQTEITDSNFQDAIDICLSTNPVDGMCSGSNSKESKRVLIIGLSFDFTHPNYYT